MGHFVPNYADDATDLNYRVWYNTKPMFQRERMILLETNNRIIEETLTLKIRYWVPQKLPQIYTVIAYIYIGKVA